jgi:thiosulfate/3-mercaptopyruvate sulfurtransferase
MLPDAETFGRSVGALGIGPEDRIVVYDGSGTQLSAPRVWWTFRVFGHRHVAVLDGGMVRWKRRGLPTAMGTASRSPTSYQAVFHPEMVRSAEEVRRRLGDRQVQLLDARAPGRFAGTEPEPRPGIRSGHIPGAKNLPYTALTHADGTFLDPEALAERFREAGIDLDRPVVTSCGSGVTACVLALGLELTGHPDYAVYDGSWTEWGGRSDLPIEK